MVSSMSALFNVDARKAIAVVEPIAGAKERRGVSRGDRRREITLWFPRRNEREQKRAAFFILLLSSSIFYHIDHEFGLY